MGGIYVADTGNGRIQRLNYETGSFENQVSRGGAVPKDALFTDLAADHNQVYVVDEKHNQIYLFDQDLNYIDTYRGNPGSPFRELRGISIFPTEDGFYHPHKAVTVEKDRIQLFRLGMDVKRIEAVPSVFYPPSGDRKTTTLKYVLTDNGAVRLVVRDAANNIVRKIYSPEKLHSLGLNEADWDGKDDSGNMLPGGTYYFELTARDMNAYGGHSIKWVYKYCPIIIHETPVVTIASIDHEAIYSGKNAIVNYSLSQTGYVNAEVMNKDNTVIKTLKNEALENPGVQTVAWNGLDHSHYPQGDGYYTIRIQARDNDGYWGEAKSIQVALANTPPSIVLDAPNNNTFGLNAGITGSISGFLTDSYKLEYSEDGLNWSLILEKTMENENISGELGIWKTRNLPASEKIFYQLRLRAWNKAGCASSKVITVLVDNILPRISGLFAYPSYISPILAATGSTQNSSTITYLAEERNMKAGGIKFIDQYAQTRQEFELEDLAGTWQWNGTDSSGNLLDDGQICCRLTFKDLGGNETSRECRIVIDTNRFPESAAITDTVKLTEADENNWKVSWSADSTKIAYAQKEDSYLVGNIWMKNADGSGSAIKITNFSPSLRYEPWYPDMEPNGMRILFDHAISYIYIKHLANSDLSLITSGMYARWSPDGTKIAFNKNGIIYLTNPEGIEFHQLTPGWFPSWSPDSKNILYSTASNPEGSQIYSITVVGGIKTGPLINNAMYPEYSPDGNMLIYLNNHYYFSVLTRDGRKQTLIDTGQSYRHAAWSPDGARLAYVNRTGETFVSHVSRPDRYANLSAVLCMPQPGDTEIRGTAADMNFSHYTLDYGPMGSSGNWTMLRNSQLEVKSGILGDWDRSGLNGEYWLRLRAWDKALNLKEICKKVEVGILGSNLIVNGYADPGVIFPGLSGKDSTEIHYTLKGTTSSRSLKIFNEAGGEVRELSLPNDNGVYPGAYSCTWDGRDPSGIHVPYGRYTFRLQARYWDGQVWREISKQGAILVSSQLPEASITSPQQDEYVKSPVNFIGTAAGQDFDYYRLVAGQGRKFSEWDLVGEAYAPVENGLLGTWNPDKDGTYSVGLKVYNHLGIENFIIRQFKTDNTPPESNLEIQGETYQVSGKTYIGNDNLLIITSQDMGCGLKAIKFKLNDNEQTYTGPIKLESSDEFLLTYYGEDLLANQESVKSIHLVRNDLQPVTSIVIGEPKYESEGNLFISGKTQIVLKAREEGATAVPVIGTYWSISPTPAEQDQETFEYLGPITLGTFGPGKRTLFYYSRDAVGNQENYKSSGKIYVDISPPQTIIQAQGREPCLDETGRRFATSAAMYTLEAVDNESQVCHIEYQVLSGFSTAAWNGYTPGEKIFITSEGEYEIQYRAVDHVENREITKSYQVIVDNTPPEIILNGIEEGKTYAVPFKAEIEVKEAYLKEKHILLDGEPYEPGTQITKLGEHEFNVTACDWAGNSSAGRVGFTLAEATPTMTITPTFSPTPSPTCTPTTTLTATPTRANTHTPTPSSTPKVYPVNHGQVRVYPNPARNRVNFVLRLEENAQVKIDIYNLLGEKTAEIKENKAASPWGTILTWHCGQAAPGIYLCRITVRGGGHIKLLERIKVAVIGK
jgi:flagellar hook assembly protein FlgD